MNAVLRAMEDYNGIAPAHNPPYITGIGYSPGRMPTVPFVALFETAFHQWAPEAANALRGAGRLVSGGSAALGFSWRQPQIHRGTSRAKCFAARTWRSVRGNFMWTAARAAVRQPALRVISCHLGGSSTVTGIFNGVSIGTSMGLSPQSGLPQNNRVGDLDAFAVPFAMRDDWA